VREGQGDASSRLMLVADGFASGRPGQPAEEVQRRALGLVRAGVRLVQLRDHAASPEFFASAAALLADALRQQAPEVEIVVNSHLWVAEALGAGMHVGWRGPPVGVVRERLPEAFVSVAVHAPSEADEAVRAGADAVLFSPVFPSRSKPGAEGVGLDALAGCALSVPDARVFALGGIRPDRAGACRAAGAYGVAVLSGLLDAPDPRAAVAAYLSALAPTPDA
jgi:thiamine-phosphate pyrophosphorylase